MDRGRERWIEGGRDVQREGEMDGWTERARVRNRESAREKERESE